ncbi:MAG: hypothetical protein DDT21_02428 [Syntrophomonadaceae bacterium]|nr:hypothetical protein [Bacillota bacterium]
MNRPLYIDRPGARVVHRTWWDIAVGPHIETVWWGYLVPPGKWLYLEAAWLHLMRRQAPTTPGLAAVSLAIEGDATWWFRNFRIVHLMDFGTGVNVQRWESPKLGIHIPGNATLRARSSDVSTGGAYEYMISAYGIEFDA